MDIVRITIDEKGNYSVEGLDKKASLQVHRILDELAVVLGTEKTRKRIRHPLQQKNVRISR